LCFEGEQNKIKSRNCNYSVVFYMSVVICTICTICTICSY